VSVFDEVITLTVRPQDPVPLPVFMPVSAEKKAFQTSILFWPISCSEPGNKRYTLEVFSLPPATMAVCPKICSDPLSSFTESDGRSRDAFSTGDLQLDLSPRNHDGRELPQACPSPWPPLFSRAAHLRDNAAGDSNLPSPSRSRLLCSELIHHGHRSTGQPQAIFHLARPS